MTAKNQQKRVLIALYNMGGPADQNSVASFLHALFTDPDLLDIPLGRLLQNFVAGKIIKKRLHEVKERYQLMGGGSPQLPITHTVAQRLNTALLEVPLGQSLFSTQSQPDAHRPFHIVDIQPLFRYCEPSARSLLEKCVAQDVHEVWLLSQYPHCARATTGTSLREIGLEQHADPRFANLTIRTFSGYGDDPSFLELWKSRVEEAWSKLPEGRRHLLVSAHNLPLSYVAEGDPYPLQIRRTTQEVTRRLGWHEGSDWTLCWQSAVGPVRWMQPTTEQTITRLAQQGIEHILVWPLAFVSDHIETLVEIDIEYAAMAKQLGITTFARVKNFDADGDFISLLSNIVTRAAGDLYKNTDTPLLRDLLQHPAGPYCSSQPAGCLCANYYLSGRQGLVRGTAHSRVDKNTPRTDFKKG